MRTEVLTGSRERFSSTLIMARKSAIDWFPSSHEPMPDVVAQPRNPGQTACGYCHLADGTGRPENAKVSGLPTTYILGQLEQRHARERESAREGYLPLAAARRTDHRARGRSSSVRTAGSTRLIGPPLAGRYAGYLARQLLGFKSGAR
jgi:cytochrome c553